MKFGIATDEVQADDHVVTPKPMSIRRKRRLRGKAKGIARELRAQHANFDWQF